MLKKLTASGLAPIDPFEINFGERLNLITGDNGFGKSLLLDLAFWQLTNSWPAEYPLTPSSESAEVRSVVSGESSQDIERRARFSYDEQEWIWDRGRPPMSALVIYARSNGGFSIWDPARNYYRRAADRGGEEAPRAYLMTRRQIWDGLKAEAGDAWLCNGLIRDWVAWQREGRQEFGLLAKVLKALSANSEEELRPGQPARLYPNDSRDFPTIESAYGLVPAPLASEAVKRILALAYLIVWTWTEHSRAAELRRWTTPFRRLVVLFDEVEAHLHPRWQRRILPALAGIMSDLGADTTVQLIGVTHAPLLLASIEPIFDLERDRLFTLDLNLEREPPGVELRQEPFRRLGDVTAWLTSTFFDLSSTGSVEAEKAKAEATEFSRSHSSDSERFEELDLKLREVLAEGDPFWSRWRYFANRKGLTSEATPNRGSDLTGA